MIAFPPKITNGSVRVLDLCEWLEAEADANDASLESMGITRDQAAEDWAYGSTLRELAAELEGLVDTVG